MLKPHHDRPPGALSRGAALPSDVERVRDEVGRAQQRVARHVHVTISRYLRQLGAEAAAEGDARRPRRRRVTPRFARGAATDSPQGSGGEQPPTPGGARPRAAGRR